MGSQKPYEKIRIRFEIRKSQSRGDFVILYNYYQNNFL